MAGQKARPVSQSARRWVEPGGAGGRLGEGRGRYGQGFGRRDQGIGPLDEVERHEYSSDAVLEGALGHVYPQAIELARAPQALGVGDRDFLHIRIERPLGLAWHREVLHQVDLAEIGLRLFEGLVALGRESQFEKAEHRRRVVWRRGVLEGARAFAGGCISGCAGIKVQAPEGP